MPPATKLTCQASKVEIQKAILVQVYRAIIPSCVLTCCILTFDARDKVQIGNMPYTFDFRGLCDECRSKLSWEELQTRHKRNTRTPVSGHHHH